VAETDDFNKYVIWDTIHNFYIQEGTIPTKTKMLAKINGSINFKV
jgi:hypothetical protein